MININFFLLVLLLPAAVYADQANGPEVGQPAPNIIGRTLDDKSWRLKNDRGKPKVINFFWVGCQPCRQEMPELAVLEKQYSGVKFIAVHTQEETPENIIKFVKSLPAAPSTIVQTSGGIQEIFLFQGLPHTVVLDGNNVVLMNLVGYTAINMQKMNALLEKITNQSAKQLR